MADLYAVAKRPLSLYKDRRKSSRVDSEQRDKMLSETTTLYVGNLSFYTSEEQVFDLFSKVGEIKRIIMGLDRLKKTPCGFCFVEYFKHDDAVKSVQFLSDTKLDERTIRVDFDYGFEEGRQYGRGKSGGQVRDEHRMDYDPGRGGYGKYANIMSANEMWGSTSQHDNHNQPNNVNSNHQQSYNNNNSNNFPMNNPNHFHDGYVHNMYVNRGRGGFGTRGGRGGRGRGGRGVPFNNAPPPPMGMNMGPPPPHGRYFNPNNNNMDYQGNNMGQIGGKRNRDDFNYQHPDMAHNNHNNDMVSKRPRNDQHPQDEIHNTNT